MIRSLALCLVLAGCGGSAPPPATPAPTPTSPAPTPTRADPPPATTGQPPDVEAILTKMQGFTDQMCACKDKPCAQHVSDDIAKWGDEMSKQNPAPPSFSDDQTKRIQSIGEQLGSCMQKVMGGGADSQPTP